MHPHSLTKPYLTLSFIFLNGLLHTKAFILIWYLFITNYTFLNIKAIYDNVKRFAEKNTTIPLIWLKKTSQNVHDCTNTCTSHTCIKSVSPGFEIIVAITCLPIVLKAQKIRISSPSWPGPSKTPPTCSVPVSPTLIRRSCRSSPWIQTDNVCH